MNFLNGHEHIERLNQLVATPNHLNPMTKVETGASYIVAEILNVGPPWHSGAMEVKRCIGDNDKDDKNDKV